MRPLKASLFILYCTAAVAVLGTIFSHVWKSAQLASHEDAIVSSKQTVVNDDTASLPLIEPDKSQS